MLTEQRYDIILRLLEEKKTVTVAELKELLNTSESTIRRDLAYLHRKGKLIKVFGGAVMPDQSREKYITEEPTMAQKKDVNKEEKKQIAQYAATLVKEDDFVFLDAGSTTGYMLDYLKDVNAAFVTNAVSHAKKLVLQGKKVIVLGGELKEATEATVGTQAVLMLKHYHFTKCFLGTNGLTAKTGMTTPDDNEAVVKRMAIKHSKEVFVLADHTKFTKISPVSFADFTDAKIITDCFAEGYEGYENIISTDRLEQ